MAKNKSFSVSVYVQTDFTISVSAKNKREAIAKAHARVKKKQIPSSAIRKGWTDADEKFSRQGENIKVSICN